MKKYKCLRHGTILTIDDEATQDNIKRDIKINFDDLSCLLPSMKHPKEKIINKCNIVEVKDNG